MDPEDDPQGLSGRRGSSPPTANADLVPLPGGAPQPRPGDEPAGRPDPAEPMTVTVYLRRPSGGSDASDAYDLAEVAPSVVDAVRAHARSCGLTVEPSPAPEAVRLSGSVSDVERCFGVRLARWRSGDGTEAVAPEGPTRVPRALADEVLAVLGLDTRPVAHRHDEDPPQATSEGESRS